MATAPRPDQLEAFIENAPPGKCNMLNLLKFRERAVYADGRETNLSGAEAYGLYGAGVAKLIDALGGRILFGGMAHLQLIGEDPLAWDSVAIVEYPSLEAFQEMTSSEAYQAIHVHRDAGLEHQLLIRVLTPDQLGRASG